MSRSAMIRVIRCRNIRTRSCLYATLRYTPYWQPPEHSMRSRRNLLIDVWPFLQKSDGGQTVIRPIGPLQSNTSRFTGCRVMTYLHTRFAFILCSFPPSLSVKVFSISIQGQYSYPFTKHFCSSESCYNDTFVCFTSLPTTYPAGYLPTINILEVTLLHITNRRSRPVQYSRISNCM